MKMWRRVSGWRKRLNKYLKSRLQRRVIFTFWIRVVLSLLAGALVYEALPDGDIRWFLGILMGGVTFTVFSWWLLIPAVPCLVYVMLTLAYSSSDLAFSRLFRLVYAVVLCGMLIGVPPLLGALFQYRKSRRREQDGPGV